MSLATNVVNLATRVATESKSLRTLINGNAVDLIALTTVSKASLIGAINEVAASDAGKAVIDDVTASTTKVYSSSKTNAAISTAVSAVVAAAPGLLDTLNELAAALANDPNFATTMTNALALKAPIASPTFTGVVGGVTKAMVGLPLADNTADASKPVSGPQQTAINLLATNIAVGDTTTDFVATFNAGLV